MSTIVIRTATAADLDAVDIIQRACPEAAQWKVADYLDREFHVAIIENCVVGFVVSRTVTLGEREILNLAVAPGLRRKGIASALLEACVIGFKGWVFLEVRESNKAAREFYHLHEFHEVSKRPNYYDAPAETAIVMKFHSC